MSRFHRITIVFSLPGSNKTNIIFHRSLEKPHFFQETLNLKSQTPGPILRYRGMFRWGGAYGPPPGLIGLTNISDILDKYFWVLDFGSTIHGIPKVRHSIFLYHVAGMLEVPSTGHLFMCVQSDGAVWIGE